MTAIHAGAALLAHGWVQDVRIVINGGAVLSVETGVSPQSQDERHAVIVPAMPNLHSHAFQRAMAGLAEIRGPADDSFWSWRTVMYKFALSMTPDHVEAVAAKLYMEMLEAGFGRVGEFHYLHNDRDGSHYGNIAEMAERIGAAAALTGSASPCCRYFMPIPASAARRRSTGRNVSSIRSTVTKGLCRARKTWCTGCRVLYSASRHTAYAP